MQPHFRLITACVATALVPLRADTVHVLTPAGWQETPATRTRHKLAIQLDPSQTGSGRTALIVNKPEWMTLADDSPPVMTGIRVDDHSLKPGPGVSLGAFWKLPDEIRLAVSDEQNPLDQRSLQVRLDGHQEGLDFEFLPAAGPAPQKAAELRIRPRRLSPGTHELSVTIADRSPFARVMTEKLPLAVNGHRVSENGQRLTLVAGGVEYVIRPDFKRFLSVDALGLHAWPTVRFRRPFYAVRKFTRIETVVDEPAHQIIRVDALPSELESERLSRHVSLQFDFEIAGASKLLRITTRAFNRSISAGELYCYWELLPGRSYELPGAEEGAVEEHEWSMQYQDLGVVDWLFLTPRTSAGTGLGIVSPQPLGESRFGSLVIYAEPKTTRVPKGGHVELVFSLVPARTAEEVLEARRQFERAAKPLANDDSPTTLPT